MAVDIQKLFNEQLPAGLQRSPDAARAIGGKFQLNISGDGGGSWFIDCSASGPSLQPGDPGGADCTVDVGASDFRKLAEDPKEGLQLFFAGRLKLQGNQMLAMKLQKVFDLAR